MINSYQEQHELKIKELEMAISRLQKQHQETDELLEEMKRYIFKMATNQAMIAEKVTKWPFVVVEK